jgi:hypothetical protein
MVDMDDETDQLLDEFLAVAAGERTDETRERYRRTLHRLRAPGQYERAAGPGTRLLLRVPRALAETQADGSDTEEMETAPSLYTRLVTWLRRHSDAGEPDSSCALLEARARLRDAHNERRSRRSPRFYDWSRPVSYDSWTQHSYDGWTQQEPDDDDWADVISLRGPYD